MQKIKKLKINNKSTFLPQNIARKIRIWEGRLTKLNRRMLDKAQKTGTTAIFDGISVTGNVKGSHNLYLNVQFEGASDLTALLLVSKTGKLKGKVKAEYVIIERDVKGKIVAHEKVELRNGGKYKSEILAPSVMISDNSFFDGIVQMLKEEGEEKEKGEKEEAVTPPQVEETDIKDAGALRMSEAKELVRKETQKLWASVGKGKEESSPDIEIEFPLPHEEKIDLKSIKLRRARNTEKR